MDRARGVVLARGCGHVSAGCGGGGAVFDVWGG